MPRPTSSTTDLRSDLSALAYEYYINAADRGFIGLELMPIFEVAEKSAYYPKIPIESLLKMPAVKRAARGNYARSDWQFETGTYTCEEYGWEEQIDDLEAALYAKYFDSEMIANARAVDILLRAQEKRISAALFNTSNITNTANVSTEWSTVASCTPLADVETAKEAMRAASGLVPNVMAMSVKVFNNLVRAKEILDAFRYTNPVENSGRQAKQNLLAQYFGMEKVLVGGAIYDSKKKGAAFSLSDIWDDEYVLLAKVATSNDLRDPSLGRSFLWTGDSPANLIVESYREDQTRSNIIRVRHNVDEAFVFTGAGYLMGNITA